MHAPLSSVVDAMTNDFTRPLWLLKLGAFANLYFLLHTFMLQPAGRDPHLVIPAQILFAVSAYRCWFPNRYKDNVVLHDTALSSTLVTRVLATFVEVAWIYQFACVIRLLNVESVGWGDVLAWGTVAQVVVSQIFVWGAILTGRLALYFYEEVGWFLIFAANTVASAYLYFAVEVPGDREVLLQLNLLFGVFYLPWQCIHLHALRSDALDNDSAYTADPEPLSARVASHLRQSLHERKRATDAASWGGVVGLVWMIAYWATLIPAWVHWVVVVTARS